jgi:hypothetical protein
VRKRSRFWRGSRFRCGVIVRGQMESCFKYNRSMFGSILNVLMVVIVVLLYTPKLYAILPGDFGRTERRISSWSFQWFFKNWARCEEVSPSSLGVFEKRESSWSNLLRHCFLLSCLALHVVPGCGADTKYTHWKSGDGTRLGAILSWSGERLTCSSLVSWHRNGYSDLSPQLHSGYIKFWPPRQVTNQNFRLNQLDLLADISRRRPLLQL